MGLTHFPGVSAPFASTSVAAGNMAAAFSAQGGAPPDFSFAPPGAGVSGLSSPLKRPRYSVGGFLPPPAKRSALDPAHLQQLQNVGGSSWAGSLGARDSRLMPPPEVPHHLGGGGVLDPLATAAAWGGAGAGRVTASDYLPASTAALMYAAQMRAGGLPEAVAYAPSSARLLLSSPFPGPHGGLNGGAALVSALVSNSPAPGDQLASLGSAEMLRRVSAVAWCT